MCFQLHTDLPPVIQIPGTMHPLFNTLPCTLEHTMGKVHGGPSCLSCSGTWGLGRKEAVLWEQASKET